MTDESKHSQSRKPGATAKGSQLDYGFLFEANQRALERWFKGVNNFSQELAQFTQSRLQEDLTAWSTLASCRTFEDVFACQRRFAEKATSQYSEEVGKLSRLVADFAAGEQSRADTAA